MLTVASPRSGPVEVQLRAAKLQRAITDVRRDSAATSEGSRASLVVSFPFGLDLRDLQFVGSELPTRRGAT